jgi:glycosyltransferase involved in cell wall biosynthesis
MTPEPTYLAVVPAYNESGSVGRVVRSIHDALPGFDVVVVDDGSTDDTAVEAERAGAPVVRLPFNLGIGGAVQSGFRYALERDYDFMVQIDGDGQHDPGEVEKLIRTMQRRPEVDMVCGSRFLRGSTDNPEYPAPVSRRTGIHIFAFLLRRIVGPKISDPTSGFRLYNRRAIRLFAQDYPHDYPEVEAVLMLHHHRLEMCETRVRMYTREGGVSSIGAGKSAYYMIKVLLALGVGLARSKPVLEEPAV